MDYSAGVVETENDETPVHCSDLNYYWSCNIFAGYLMENNGVETGSFGKAYLFCPCIFYSSVQQ